MSRRGLLRPWLVAAMFWIALPAAAAKTEALQRGAQMFMDDCVSCHSLKYLRYNRLQQDLGLSPQTLAALLARLQAKSSDSVQTPMTTDIALLAFGKRPPDLSLEANLRGSSWLRQYLSRFYLDPHSTRGWNNPLLPGVAMPNPFWQLQGIRADNGHAQPGPWVQSGTVSPQQFAAKIDDLVDFLDYVAAPEGPQRHRLGPWVLAFIAVFTVLAAALKRQLWQRLAAKSDPA